MQALRADYFEARKEVTYAGVDIEEWQERSAIMEFDGGLTREQAEQSATVRTRPPTKQEAIDWIKRHQSDPHYCRECFRLWKRSMGAQLAKAIFDEAPESVRKWINARAAK